MHRFSPDHPVFLLGGGPSLRALAGHRLSRRQTLAIHDSHRLVPWADVLLIKDKRWFEPHRDPHGQHCHRIRNVGSFVSTSAAVQGGPVAFLDPEALTLKSGKKRQRVAELCAGAQAVALALHLGATSVVLLGFDASPGHWAEGERFAPKRLPDGEDAARVRRDFAKLARLDLPVVNATPGSLLEGFPAADLDALLAQHP